MSKTPRTDEYAGISEDFRGVEVVPADISRELEKRLAEAQAELADKDKQLAEVRAEIDGLTLMATNASMEPARRLIQKNKELHAVIEQMRDALRLALPEARSTHVEQTILAALAAERGE